MLFRQIRKEYKCKADEGKEKSVTSISTRNVSRNSLYGLKIRFLDLYTQNTLERLTNEFYSNEKFWYPLKWITVVQTNSWFWMWTWKYIL